MCTGNESLFKHAVLKFDSEGFVEPNTFACLWCGQLSSFLHAPPNSCEFDPFKFTQVYTGVDSLEPARPQAQARPGRRAAGPGSGFESSAAWQARISIGPGWEALAA